LSNKPLGFWILTALVIGNMVGSGIFMLPSDLAQAASPGGVLFTWILTGVGVLFIALIFGNLAVNKPHMTGGPQIYAKGLFKEGSKSSILSGYSVSWGYWVANFAGNVAVITSFAGYLSTFFPILNNDALITDRFGLHLTVGRLTTFIVCSVLLWGLHALILNGVEGAGKVNFIATFTKVAGFILFIIATLFAFQSSHLVPFIEPKVDPSTGVSTGLLGQINHAALSTLWAFVGVESAVVFSSRARRPIDVKRATIVGLITATVLYIGITLLVMGSLKESALAASSKPLVDALTAAIGSAGGYLLGLLAVICLFGSTVGWIMLSAEVPYQAAKQGLFLKVFMKENKKGTPVRSLTITNVATQILLLSTISNSIAEAFSFVITIATLAYLLPYLVTAIFQIKTVLDGSYDRGTQKMWNAFIGIVGLVYSVYVIIAATSDLSTFLWGVFFIGIGVVFSPSILKSHKDRVSEKTIIE
jgi:arginine:ornithine antiporter / lysine permease